MAIVATYAAFRADDGSWFVNEYKREYGRPRDWNTRRTLYDGLTEAEADELVAFLERFADKVASLPGAVSA